MHDATTEAAGLAAAHRHREALALLDRAALARGGAEAPAGRLVRVAALHGLERHEAARSACELVLRDGASSALDRARARVLAARTLLRTGPLVDEALELACDAAAEARALAGAAPTAEARDLAASAHLEAAHAFARKGCRALAEHEIAAARQWLGDDGRVAATAARLALAFDDRVAARELFTVAAGTGGAGRRAGLLGLCQIAALNGDFETAHAHLDALGPAAADDREAGRARLRLLLARGRWRDAVTLLDELLAASPEADTAAADRHARAVALYHAGERDAARDAWAQLAAAATPAPVVGHARRNADRLAASAVASPARHRLAAFPSVAQLRNHCGPAAVELLLRFFGVAAEQVEIARAVRIAASGTPVHRLRCFLDAAGFATRRIAADLAALRTLLDAGVPVIMEEDWSASRHVAVAIGYDDELGVLVVQDPMSHEVRETPYEQLEQLRAFSNHGALVAVPREQAARLDAAGATECRWIAAADEAWAASEAGRDADAERLIDEALALRRDHELAWSCRFHRAFARAAAAGADEAARTRLREIVADVVALWPDEEWPRQWLGEVALLERRWSDAQHAFALACRRDPGDPRNWVRLAECQLAAGQEDDAHQSFARALRLDPGHARANEAQAWQYWRLGRTTLAGVANAVARELAPHNAHTHALHATLLAKRGEVDGALAAWQEAERRLPSHLPFVVERARLLARTGRIDDAVAVLTEAAARRPGEPALRVDLAELLHRHGRFAAARAVCAEVRALEPQNVAAIAIDGAAACALGAHDEGMRLLQQALAARPTYAWALAELGKSLGGAKRHAEAAYACAAAFGLSGAPAHELALATVLLAAGAGPDAARRARAALATGRLDGAEVLRAASVVASGAGLPAAHAALTELARREPRDVELVRAHAHLLLEVEWAPALARPVIDRLATLAPDDPLVAAARGRMLSTGPANGHAEGEAVLRAVIARAPQLVTPRRLLADGLVARERHAEALDVLQPCPGAFVDTELRVAATLGLGRAGEAEALAGAFAARVAVTPAAATAVPALAYRIARHRGDWQQALGLVEELARRAGDQDGDGRLGPWEAAKFECLARLGEVERARRFGERQAGDANASARLAAIAFGAQQRELAGHFAARALRMDSNDRLAQSIQAGLAPASAPAATGANAAAGVSRNGAPHTAGA